MNFDWAHRWIKSFAESPEKGASFYADEFLFEDIPFGARITDKAELKEAFGMFANTDPSNPIGIHVFEVERYTGSSDNGVVNWVWHARHLREFAGLTLSGEEMVIHGMSSHEYKNGKIVRECTFSDIIAVMMRQLGHFQ
ncbi:MAG: ester cyclase [Candidatus Binatia bacterium]